MPTVAALVVAAALLATPFLVASPVQAQQLDQVQTPATPIVLRSRGSFIVGGQSVLQTPTQISYFADGLPHDGGKVTVNQMYVEYMVPEPSPGLPLVMIHGATLSAKSYDTTPDGRMGWYEYFVRQGHPVYLPDQVSRGRSGFDIATYNDVRAGLKPVSSLANLWRFADDIVWSQFRFGSAAGKPFNDTQFPTQAVGQLSRQAIPDLNYLLPDPNPNIDTVARLGAQLQGAVLIGHSQTGGLPLDVLLANPAAAKALVLLEPGTCRSGQWTDQQVASFAKVPILAVYGDHLDVVTGTPMQWTKAFEDCKALLARIKAAGGTADLLHPPELGIRGNSHLLMQDKNNLQIADLILKWLNRQPGTATRGRTGK